MGQLNRSGRNEMENINRRKPGLAGQNGPNGWRKRAAFRVLSAKTCFPVDGGNVSACSTGDDDGE